MDPGSGLAARAAEAARLIFGHKQFRPLQEEIIVAAVQDNDIFVLLPTGGGKSLCYQLPALLVPGITVVVSPLLALIQDQERALAQPLTATALGQLRHPISQGEDPALAGVPATYLGSNAPTGHAQAVYADLALNPPLTKLLYVTPEQLLHNETLRVALSDLSRHRLLARIVIDEAHCVSHWGHDFRKDYTRLGTLRKLWKGVPFTALTATATTACQVDVRKLLQLRPSCRRFSTSFNRPNLSYSVVRKAAGMQNAVGKLLTYVQQWPQGTSGVVYCLTRKETEEVCSLLRENGVSCSFYHAGMTPAQRQKAQKEWQRGASDGGVALVCATIAMGMGIDKADVRYVAHFSAPKSLEGYYQESGRAGRDGARSECIIFYCPRDLVRLKALARASRLGKNQYERAVQDARRVEEYCEGKDKCRRCSLLLHFEEFASPTICNGMCDVCDPAFEQPPWAATLHDEKVGKDGKSHSSKSKEKCRASRGSREVTSATIVGSVARQTRRVRAPKRKRNLAAQSNPTLATSTAQDRHADSAMASSSAATSSRGQQMLASMRFATACAPSSLTSLEPNGCTTIIGDVSSSTTDRVSQPKVCVELCLDDSD